MPRYFALLYPLLALPLGACGSGTDDEDQTATPQPQLTGQPVATQAADGTALTAGSWVVEENADGASAAFTEANSEPHAILACNRGTGALTLTRAADATGPRAFLLQVGGLQARVDMTPVEGPLPGYMAEVDGSLPIFAAMADPAESIRLSGVNAPDLIMPANSGILRVLEACR